jgi:hypothetical protein
MNTFAEDMIVRMKTHIENCYDDARRAFDQGYVAQAKALVKIGRESEEELARFIGESDDN